MRAELLPDLVELAADEESSVRLAAFDTIIGLMEMMDDSKLNPSPICRLCGRILPTLTLLHPPGDRLTVLLPLLMSVCDESPPVDEAVVTSLSFQFGKICSGLSGASSLPPQQDLVWIRMSSRSESEGSIVVFLLFQVLCQTSKRTNCCRSLKFSALLACRLKMSRH